MAVRHNPRCALCGAPTQARPFREGTAWVCTDCGSLTVEATVARRLLAAPPPAPALEHTQPVLSALGARPEPTAELTPPVAPARPPPPADAGPGRQLSTSGAPSGRRPRRRRTRSSAALMLGLATSVALLVLAVPASVLVYEVVRDQAASRRAAEAPKTVALAETLGGPAPPVVLPDPEPLPEDPPDEAEAPSDQGPALPSAALLVREGWRVVDGDPEAAAARFRKALAERPRDPEAEYGLGYALLKSGDRPGASRWLCEAQATGSQELHREVQSLLDHNGLTCSP